MNFKTILVSLYFITILLSCTISLLFIGGKAKPAYMKNFFLYPLLAFLFLLNKLISLENLSYGQYMTAEVIQIIYNLSYILHFYLLGSFVKKNITSFRKNEFLNTLFWFFFIIVNISIFATNLSVKNGLAYGITNSCLIIFCILYYQQLFKNPPTIILIHNSAFWIINGIFFGMTTTIPINFSGDFFIKDGSEESIQILRNLGLVSYLIMHLFFIKAYLCIVRPNKVL